MIFLFSSWRNEKKEILILNEAYKQWLYVWNADDNWN